jgi:small subunit ribosomal protein S1
MQDYVEKINDHDMDEFETAIMSGSDRPVQSYRRGDIVTVKVVKADADCLLVDVGRKSEVFIPIEEVVHDPNLPLDQQYKVGEEISVKVVRDEKSKGGVFLSNKRAVYYLQINELENLYRDLTPIDAKVLEKVKGGLIVDIQGIQGFLPGSLVSQKRTENLDQFVGQVLPVKIIEFDKDRKKIIVSHKIVEEEAQIKNKEALVATLEIGSIIEGTVTNVVDYGAFVDIGSNVEGLIHISELSWSGNKRPSDVLKKGQIINIRVIGLSDDRDRISLSFKRTLPDPWDNIADKYQVGQIVKGMVVKDLEFGAIVELEGEISAFIHISQLSNHRINSLRDVLTVGDEIEAEIVEIEAAQKRIKLSRRSLLPVEEESMDPYTAEGTPQSEIQKDDYSSYVDVFVPKK